MRVHFQQLTEPIASLVVDHHERSPSFFTFLTPTQLKSQASPPRRLPASPRACGDPIS